MLLKLTTKSRMIFPGSSCLLYEAIQNRLYCGRYPGKNPFEFAESCSVLRVLGIDTVIDFTEDNECTSMGQKLFKINWERDPVGVFARLGVEQVRSFKGVRIPVVDDHPPTSSQAVKFCRLLDTEFMEGRRVYIHCRGGIGRTATMACAYLLWSGLASPRNWRRTINNLRREQHRDAPMPLQVDWLKQVWIPYCENFGR